MNALGQSALPRMASYAAGDERGAFSALLLKLLTIGAALGTVTLLVAWRAGRQILTVLYRPEYGVHTVTLMWLMAAAATSYLGGFLGVALTAVRHFRVQLWLHGATCVVAGISSWLLVGNYGLPGAGMAAMATWAFVTLSYAAALLIYLRLDVALARSEA